MTDTTCEEINSPLHSLSLPSQEVIREKKNETSLASQANIIREDKIHNEQARIQIL